MTQPDEPSSRQWAGWGCLLLVVFGPLLVWAAASSTGWYYASWVFAWIVGVAAAVVVYRAARRSTPRQRRGSPSAVLVVGCLLVLVVALFGTLLLLGHVANPHRSWVACMHDNGYVLIDPEQLCHRQS